MKKDYPGQASPAIALHRSAFILQQKADELLNRQVGIGLSSVRIMSQLHQSVPRSQRTIAVGLHQTEANVSRQLQSMKKAGLVSVVKNKSDRRVREVTLTAKGAKVYTKAENLLNKQYKNIGDVEHLAERLRFLA
jgi:DNA-binding MarR family transcriptional regulator